MTAYYINFFKSRGFDYLKLDFLTHGALEGLHYDTNVTTGIQAYSQGHAYLVVQNNGRCFLSESIAPIFPYQYAHARRIYCDTAGSISDTAATMQSVNYGWWLSDRLYQFQRFRHDEICRFLVERKSKPFNQRRNLRTVFLNSDDLASPAGQSLARTCLTNARINEIAVLASLFVQSKVTLERCI